jgi:hypothetical protein
MNGQEKTAFISGYTKLLTTAWTNEEFAATLRQNPKAALAQCGLMVPGNATVEIVTDRPDPASGDLNQEMEYWEEGLASGRIVLHVPHAVIRTKDLVELALGPTAKDTTVCCCCCPCCSCT